MSPGKDDVSKLEELIWVEDLRSNRRFIVRRPLEGEVDGEDAQIKDLSVTGCRVAHRMPVRVGADASLRLGTISSATLDAKVIWSRLSDDRDEVNTMLYTSGMRIVDDPKRISSAVEPLVRDHCRPDTSSMETKRAQALERLSSLVTVERERLTELTPDELLESYRALAEVALMSDEQKRSLIEEAKRTLAAQGTPSAWSRDVLAAWKSIDGSLELETIEAARKILVAIDRFVEENDG